MGGFPFFLPFPSAPPSPQGRGPRDDMAPSPPNKAPAGPPPSPGPGRQKRFFRLVFVWPPPFPLDGPGPDKKIVPPAVEVGFFDGPGRCFARPREKRPPNHAPPPQNRAGIAVGSGQQKPPALNNPAGGPGEGLGFPRQPIGGGGCPSPEVRPQIPPAFSGQAARQKKQQRTPFSGVPRAPLLVSPPPFRKNGLQAPPRTLQRNNPGACGPPFLGPPKPPRGKSAAKPQGTPWKPHSTGLHQNHRVPGFQGPAGPPPPTGPERGQSPGGRSPR